MKLTRIIEDLSNPSEGDIILLKYGSFEKPYGKSLVTSHHLFVVVKTNPITVCSISSVEDKVNERFPWNIPIKNLEGTNLRKPSHVKVDNSGIISEDDPFKFVGKLSDEDMANVLSKYKEAPQNYILECLGGQVQRRKNERS